MFSVYSNENSVFSGTLENLITVKPPPEVVGATLKAIQPEVETVSTAYQPSRGALDTYRDLIHADPKEKICHVHEVMHIEYLLINDDLPFHEALVKMTAEQVHAAPVINQQGRFIGVLDALSIIERLAQPEADLAELRISQVRNCMTADAITTVPVTSIRRVAQVMQAYNLEIVPVVDQFEIVVGVVTPLALAKVIAIDPPISVWT